jgi:hypothetical protein
LSPINNEIELINHKTDDLLADELPHFDSLEDLFELLKRAPELYIQQNHDERARMLRIVTSNCEVTTGSIVPIYRTPFSGIAEGLDSGTPLSP